jgi:glucokinase
MDLLAAAPVITDAEYETAVQNILACQDVATLQKWYRNCIREIARREEAEPEAEVIEYATAEQKREITTLANSVWILRKEKTHAMLRLPQLNHAQAVALIGELWAKMLRRQARAAEGHADASSSFSSAA